MEVIILYALVMTVAINGILLMGMLHRYRQLERLQKDAIRRLYTIAVSRRR